MTASENVNEPLLHGYEDTRKYGAIFRTQGGQSSSGREDLEANTCRYSYDSQPSLWSRATSKFSDVFSNSDPINGPMNRSILASLTGLATLASRSFTDSVLPIGVGLVCLASSIHDIRQVFRNAELVVAATAYTCPIHHACDSTNSVRSATTSEIGEHGGGGDPHDEPKD